MYQIRSKFGAKPTPMKDTLREEIKNKNIPHGLAMVADQTPMKHEIQLWTTFLNQDTPFYIGADKIGRMLQMPVYFVGMKRIRRGHYEIFFKEIANPPYPEGEFYVTEKYAKMLEEEIRTQPANWLWSHRRWKHTR
jgi:KDO2-lipid IV(A) lauroyltransferase